MGTRKQSARLRQKTLERLHAALVERQRRLIEGEEACAAGRGNQPRYESADDLEMAADLSDREILYRIAEHHSDELAGIGDAIQKMEDGRYGICEECDSPIRAARLRALPHARLCVRCQRERERCAEGEDDGGYWGVIGASGGGESASRCQTLRATARR